MNKVNNSWPRAQATYLVFVALILAGCGGGNNAPTQLPVAPVAADVNAQSEIIPDAVPNPVVPAKSFEPTYVSDMVPYDGTQDGSLKKTDAIEKSAQSQHEITLPEGKLTYIATAGHLNVADVSANEEPRARLFYVAYTVETPPGAPKRPVTFFYNGGPGSSSVWLHLGSFGPRRLEVNAPNYYSDSNKDGVSPQFPMVDNKETLLTTSDLVFVDAIATGYSQAIEPKKNIDFWNTDADAAVYRDFVIRYLSVNKRLDSPYYLTGESYGGPRTAVLSRLLVERGYLPVGIILISPILDYNSTCAKDTAIGGTLYISCAGFVPTYAAVAAHYNPALIGLGKTFASHIEQGVVPYVANTYMPALKTYMAARQKYFSIPSTDVAGKAAAKKDFDQAKVPMDVISIEMKASYGVNLVYPIGMPYNPKPVRVYEIGGTFPDKELGRYDSRIAVPGDSRWAKEGDPSSTLLNESYGANIKEYLNTRLNYSASVNYALRANDTWTFSHLINGVPAVENPKINQTDTIPDIKAALKLHPKMKIMVTGGYNDLATPFYLTKLDLDRLGADERKNLTIKNYEGGHMIYLTNVSRVSMKPDLEKFYQSSPIQ